MHGGNKVVTALVWLLTAIGAIHLGLIGLGYNLWEQSLIQNTEFLRKLVVPLHWLIGIAGVLSLIFYIQWVASGCHECHCTKR